MGEGPQWKLAEGAGLRNQVVVWAGLEFGDRRRGSKNTVSTLFCGFEIVNQRGDLEGGGAVGVLGAHLPRAPSGEVGASPDQMGASVVVDFVEVGLVVVGVATYHPASDLMT